ncbi:VOC family protein [Streptomyces sp. NPDC000927]|uniref:VOC family protein n=1 Tax=Streptomyces sp. NPDC000927 TaxID=3154371 RepID=UPI00331EBFB4
MSTRTAAAEPEGASGGTAAPRPLRAFPLLSAHHVARTAAFYERLGFTRLVQHPPTGEPAFVGLHRDGAELAVSAATELREPGGPYEMFVFVEDVDQALERLRTAGVPVLGEPVDMPWRERVARVADPDGNSVALASPASG